ncbi:hypothetical protein Tco_0436277, partial [Tanacetum coccineum]
MVERDDEIKVLGEIKLELQSGTQKMIEKLSQKKVSQQEALENEIKEEDIEEEAFEEFSLTLDNVLEKLSQENESLDDFYGLMYDTDDDASISGKSCEHFGWDWDSPVTFLEKPTECEGFEEIFWDTVNAKTVNGEVQLYALVDKKKVIITESTIRRDLQLEVANGVDCLPNAVIFNSLHSW